MEQINNEQEQLPIEGELQSPQERVKMFVTQQALHSFVSAFSLDDYNCRRVNNNQWQLVYVNNNGG